VSEYNWYVCNNYAETNSGRLSICHIPSSVRDILTTDLIDAIVNDIIDAIVNDTSTCWIAHTQVLDQLHFRAATIRLWPRGQDNICPFLMAETNIDIFWKILHITILIIFNIRTMLWICVRYELVRNGCDSEVYDLRQTKLLYVIHCVGSHFEFLDDFSIKKNWWTKLKWLKKSYWRSICYMYQIITTVKTSKLHVIKQMFLRHNAISERLSTVVSNSNRTGNFLRSDDLPDTNLHWDCP